MTVDEIQPADPRARRLAIAIAIIGALAGATLIALFESFRSEVRAWIREDFQARGKLVLLIAAVLTTAPLMTLAVCLWRLGGRVSRAGRYPPPGLRVTRDTTVATGPAAHRRARRLKTVGIFLAAAGALLAFFLWRFAAALRIH